MPKVEKAFLIPAKGCQVRKEVDPKQFVKPTGEKLPLTIYYKRRLRRGELTVKSTPKKTVKKKSEENND